MDVVLAAMVVLASAIAAVLVRRLHRDESFVGVEPGESPAADQAAERRRGGPASAPAQARTMPPTDLGPGLTGVVLDGRADPIEVVATLIDAAEQGRLTIAERPVPVGADFGSDWLFSRTDLPVVADASSEVGATAAEPEAESGEPAALVLPSPEDKLVEVLFGDAHEVLLSELPLRRRRELNEVADVLLAAAEQRSWFRRLSHPADAALRVTGPALLLLGAAAIVMLGRAWLGGGMMLAGVIFWVLTQGLPNPPTTAEGFALRVQALGFRAYLAQLEPIGRSAEAVAAQVRWLPYAMVFGGVDGWRERLLEAAGTSTPDGFGWLIPLATDGRLLAADGALPRLLADLSHQLVATRPIAEIPSGASSAVPREPAPEGSLLTRLTQR
jgi:Predicted membrane protein (DUF2207).